MKDRYYLKNIHNLLIHGFNDSELRQLCFYTEEFRPVYDQLAQNTPKDEIAHKLLEYAQKTLQIELLLFTINTRNPNRYQEHEPYYREDVVLSLQEHVVNLSRQLRILYSHNRRVLMELLAYLTESSYTSSIAYPNLAGIWKGLVNRNNQIIEIKQLGPQVFLNGTALDDTGNVDYTFYGEGRIILDVLIFFWQHRDGGGINIMKVLSGGDVLDGKFFHPNTMEFDSYSFERYERIDAKFYHQTLLYKAKRGIRKHKKISKPSLRSKRRKSF